ncbi:MAG: DUF4340 domain-containing protein [Deltaproteobacteria bacterium]|nr:DUF4340 domain-containing protein [Deltaproteobacteria bacterium]
MSPRALSVLSGVVALLAAAVVLDEPPKARTADSHRVLPGLAPGEIARLSLRAAGAPEVVLERRGAALTIVAPAEVPADATAVNDLLSSLEHLSFRRRLRVPPDGGGLATPRHAISLRLRSGRSVDLLVGRDESALGGTWVGTSFHPGEVFLVDEYMVRALDRGLGDLRRRDLFRQGEDALRLLIELGGKRLSLREPACLQAFGGCVRADDERVALLVRQLLDLRISRFLDEKTPFQEEGRIVVEDETIQVGGPCPHARGERMVKGSLGAACAREDALAVLRAGALDPLLLVERRLTRLLPGEVSRIEIDRGDGSPLVRKREGVAWPEAERTWLEELSLFRAVAVAKAAPVSGHPLAKLTLVPEQGEEERLSLLAQGQWLTVQRTGEPVALRVHPSAARFFDAADADFQDPELLALDPSAVTAIELERDGNKEVLIRTDTGVFALVAPVAMPADDRAVPALLDAAAHLRGERIASMPSQKPLLPRRAQLSLVTREARHVVELGWSGVLGSALGMRGCSARLKGSSKVAWLSAERCSALTSFLASRTVLGFSSKEALRMKVGERNYERHDGRWYADGAPLGRGESSQLDGCIDSMATAEEVAGYGKLAGTPVVVASNDERVALRCTGGTCASPDRPTLFRIASKACDPWMNDR